MARRSVRRPSIRRTGRPSKGKPQGLGDTTDPHGLAALGTEYLQWMKVVGYSPATVHNRTTYLRLFVDWCTARGIERPTDVIRPVLERYQRHLHHYRKKNGESLSYRSQHCRLVPVRALFRWLARQNYILHNPASELQLPKLRPRLPKAVLTIDEAEQILAQPDTTHPIGLRDRAILETLYSTGIRRLELIRLQLEDLDAERGTLLVRQGKGGKDRMLPIGDRAATWVQRYVEQSRLLLLVSPTERTLFISNLGEPLATDSMTGLVGAYVDAAEIGKRGACHLFRHTMATLMLEGGADIRFIQQMLGHASLSTTQLYTQVSIRQLKAIHTATHPGRIDPADGPIGDRDEQAAQLLLDLELEDDEEDDELG